MPANTDNGLASTELESLKARQGQNLSHLGYRLDDLFNGREQQQKFYSKLLRLTCDLTNAQGAAVCHWDTQQCSYQPIQILGDTEELIEALRTKCRAPLNATEAQNFALPDRNTSLNAVAGNYTDAGSELPIALVIIRKSTTPYADALSIERLSLCAAYLNFLVNRNQDNSASLLRAIDCLTGDLPLSQRYQNFIDAWQAELGLEEVYLGLYSSTKICRCYIANEPNVSNASQTVAEFKSEANAAHHIFQTQHDFEPHADGFGNWKLLPIVSQRQVFGVLGIPLHKWENFEGSRIERAAKEISPIFGLIAKSNWRHAPLKSLRSWFGANKNHKKIALGLLMLALAPFPDSISATFNVAEVERRVVTAPFDGILKTVEVDVEDQVRQGKTVLGTLSIEQIELRLSQEKTKLVAAKAEQALAENRFDAAEAKIAELNATSATAEIALLEYRKGMARLTPQIDGIVTKSDFKLKVGSMVRRGETLFEISNTEQLQMDIFVPDDKISMVSIGAKGRAALAAQPNLKHEFEVKKIFPVAETIAARRVFRVVARFDDVHTNALRPGMEGVAKIDNGWSIVSWILSRDAIGYLRSHFWI